MAIAVLWEMPGYTREQYEADAKSILKGEPTKLANWPVKGILAHMAGPTPNGWQVVDVWESEAAAQEFGKTIAPILKERGFPNTEPKIIPLTRFTKD